MRPSITPIELRPQTLRILDQTLLPGETHYIETSDYRDVCDATRRLAVRGAPLIGIAAAYGLVLAMRAGIDARTAAGELAATRPTAVNLRWALDRMLEASDGDAERAEIEARRIHEEQIGSDARCAAAGVDRVLLSTARAFGSDAERRQGVTLLTHCNTGTLATGGMGTALGVVKAAHRRGLLKGVLVDETRPLLQGARLTSWELSQERIPHHVIVDGAAAALLARGDVDAVLVGADRLARNGDTANKIGTYGLALAARANGVPFFVVAPTSTIDKDTATGADIVVEHRDSSEVLAFGGTAVAPSGVGALNPAFDVTPCEFITAIIVDGGTIEGPVFGDIFDDQRLVAP